MNEMPSLALPWHFDTSPVVKVILRGVGGLLLLIVIPGILYAALVAHNRTAAVQLLLVGGLVTYFGRAFLRTLDGSRGTVTADAVVVAPAVLYGVSLSGPEGRFPIDRFRAVGVELVAPPLEARGSPHERVSFLGKDGTPDILVARAEADAGRALGRELAAAVGLPYEEAGAPY